MREQQHARLRAALLVATLAPCGVLLRIVVTRAFYPGSLRSAVPSSFAANLLGSALLGILHAHSGALPDALNAGLSSGFCASLTTFASATFHSAVHVVRRDGGRAATSLLITALSAPAAYTALRDVASYFTFSVAHFDLKQPIRTAICAAICLIMLLILLVTTFVTRDVMWLAALLSPLGALTRFALSTKFNKEGWPWGTLAANLAAAALDAALAAVRYRRKGDAYWISALRLGVVGALGTISALASEIVALGRIRVLYASVSFLLGVLIIVVIYGVVVWTS